MFEMGLLGFDLLLITDVRHPRLRAHLVHQGRWVVYGWHHLDQRERPQTLSRHVVGVSGA